LHILSFQVFTFGSLVKQSSAEFTCDKEDYSPCSCGGLDGSDANYVECDQRPVREVIAVFNRTQAIELAELSFAKNREDDVIPNNFISDKKAGELLLFCYDSDSSTKTNIEKDAFNSTKQYTTILDLSFCRLRDSDLSFLDGFDKLSYLRIDAFDEMGRLFPTFPSNFPEIKNFKFTRCIGWDTLVNAPSHLVGSKKLKRLDINSDDLDLVDLSNCGVEEIEPNAFEGESRNTLLPFKINKDHN